MDLMKELPVSLRLIREIHEQLMHGVRGAERNPVSSHPGKLFIVRRNLCPPAHEMSQALDNLEKFIHSSQPMPTLIKVGAHAQFETIHPFLDGNGRTGRLLITCCANKIYYRDHYFISPTSSKNIVLTITGIFKC